MKILFSLVLVLLFTACGGGAGSEVTGTADEGITIRMVVQESEAGHVQQIIDLFNVEHPDIQVELTALVNFEAVNQNILMSHQAGSGFDLMYINHVDTLAYIIGGIIRPIDDFAAADGIDYNQIIFPSVLEEGMYQDVLYSIPINTSTRVLAINVDLLEQYGQSFPTTLEQMLEVAEAVTVDGNFGFANAMTRHAYMSTYEQGVFLMSMGGRLYEIEDDGRAVATIDTPEMREFLEFNRTLLNFMPGDALTKLEDDGRRAFASGNVGMYIWGAWEFDLMPELPFEKELILIPAGANGSASTTGGFQVAMGADSQHPEAAWQLFRFMTTNPEILVLAAATSMPTSPLAYDLPPFNDPMYDIFQEQLWNAGLPQVPVANMHEVVTEFDTYWQDFLFGRIDVEEAVTRAQVSVQNVLDRTN